MSASESSPLTANLQESIEHLIAETVRRSQTSHEEEQMKLREALQQALVEIEASQAAISRAVSTIQAALDTSQPTPAAQDGQVDELVAESPAPMNVAQAAEVEEVTPQAESGPHKLDIIGHDVNIGIATSLQAMLRGRSEVESAQTREFVNGELRLHLQMGSGLNMDSFNAWITEHKGRITAQTDSVIELRFGD